MWSYQTHAQAVFQGVNDIDLSSNGSYIVVGTEYSYVYLFNKSNDTPSWSYQEGFIDNYVTSVSISANGEYIAAGYRSGSVYAFHRSSGVPLWQYIASGAVTSVEISSDGRYIIAGSRDNKVYLFNTTDTLNPLVWNYTTNGVVSSVAVSKNGSYFVAGSWDFNVYCFNISTLPSLMWNFTAGKEVMDVAISSEGNYIVAGSDDKKLYLFNKLNFNPQWNYTTQGLGFSSVVISADGNNIAATTWAAEDRIYVFNRSSSNPIWMDTYDDLTGSSLVMSSDGTYITVAGYIDGVPQFIVFLSSNPNPLWTFEASTPYRCAISDNNKYFAFGNRDRYIYLYSNNPPTLSSDAGSPDIDGSFSLFWDTSNNLDNFSIYVHNSFITEINTSITKLDDGITDLNYSISGLLSGDYYYIVEGINTSSSIVSNCIHVSVEQPPLDFILSSTADPIDTDGSFYLNWTEALGTNNYSIFIHNSTITTINTSVSEVANGITGFSYPISGLNNGDYYFVVVAFNEFGSVMSNCIRISVGIPPKFFTLETDADDPDIDGVFNLNWEQSIGADNYSVYVHNNYISELTGSETLLAENITALIYPISGLFNGDYFYVVIAYNETGKILSNCIKVSVRIPPESFILSSDAEIPDVDGTFNLTWSISKGADNYSVFVHSSFITEITGSETKLADEITDLIYLVSGLLNGDYYFIVVAYNRSGNTISNCIQIQVELPPDTTIALGDYYLLYFGIAIISLVIIKKRLIRIRNK